MIYSIIKYIPHSYFTSFHKFSITLIKIQQQSSIKQKKSILQNYYYLQSPNHQKSIKQILQFIQNKPKIGFAQKSITNYILSRFFPNQSYPNLNFQQLINLLTDQPNSKALIQLENIQKLLVDLQAIQGKGSMNEKVNKLDQIVPYLSQIQLKILMRIINKNLRIGIATKLMDSFLSSFTLQNNIINQRNQNNIHPPPIKYHTNFIQPMLAKPLKSISEVYQFCEKKGQKDLIADIKYDGQRTLICFERGKQLYLTSRRRKPQNEVHSVLYSKLTQQLNKMQFIQSIKIDGQILCISQNGQPLPMSMVRTKVANTDENQSQKLVFAFDVLQYNGISLLNHKLIDRRKYIPQSDHIKLCEYLQFTYPQQKQSLLQYYKTSLIKKYQGLIIKGKDDQYYTNGTRRMWGKFKRGCKINQQSTGAIDLDLVVMGVIYGEGKRNPFFATFLLGAYQGQYLIPITRIGTGFTEDQLSKFTDIFNEIIVQPMPGEYVMPSKLSVSHFVKPIYVFQVSCQQFTRSPLYQIGYQEGMGGLSLRFPVFVRFRDDKQPKSCKVEEILQYAGNF